ncbi:3-oxoacyl-ACP synthase [Fibrella sp. HMF5335]|uniref:3-oxoacyl-ACP synthase n=1 Tax=Fibrella rubiginis TaxID=2817060 RepID=A0A939GP46_9BACT|nr:3-oxoacyl-ACP synthase [Fibrella rubiginis]MBO0940038.1 3-oxoacyl-ACP synthase [Fibrella rubiginis]
MKNHLYDACMAYVQQRIQTATEAMTAAQESANAESKSSAGDKYETGRAMAQLERDRHAQLLADAQRMRQELEHLDPLAPPGPVVRPGSLVLTSAGNFYIAISAGRLLVDGQPYMAVSPASPIGALLRGKSVGEVVTFNKQTYLINGIL